MQVEPLLGLWKRQRIRSGGSEGDGDARLGVGIGLPESMREGWQRGVRALLGVCPLKERRSTVLLLTTC